MRGFEGKVAVITGGGRGIGRGVALALAEEKVRVVVNDVYKDESGKSAADVVVEEIGASGGEALANYENIASWSGSQLVIDSAIERFGRVDILVMCAGNNVTDPFLDVSEEDWDRTMAIHVKGHSGCARAAAKKMIEQNDGGRIITFSSRAAFRGRGVYAVAKAAIMGISGALARELEPHGITVNCILPSAETQLFPGGNPQMRRGDGTPEPLDLRPEAIAPLIAYLVSEDAADITNRFIYASGSDVLFYEPPFIPEGHSFIRKQGSWTPDELSVALPSLLGLQR
jgi:NAD(P)-dependent dehydrogenase (short-subunit alcohol dehydrogenase family)